jgi:glycosyltransferase involved in cell wall biosynthesis
MSDLLVCSHTPALGTGQAVRTYGIARALAAHGPLTLLYVRFGAPEPDGAFRAIPGIELREVVPSRGAARVRGYLSTRAAGVPDHFARGISPELASAAADLARAPGRGRVIADGPIVAAALRGLADGRPVIYNSHNLESAFRGDLSGVSTRDQRALRSFERGLLARAAEAWMVSEADLRGAHELCPEARLRYVPNVVDVAAIEPVTPDRAALRAAFVANFVYEPNRNGLHFLVRDVFPRVWSELPEARLALAGGGIEQPPLEDERVEQLGFVSDLAAAYASASCAVVPLLQGGGTPLKLIEALAYGLPVIATPRAVAGLEVHSGEHCLVASGADEFAAALVAVLREGAPEIARRGRELAARLYSIEALATILAPSASNGHG